MKHKTKNRFIKKKKGRKTKKMKMKGGGLFSSMSFGIPGFGSAGTCPDKQYYDPKYGWLNQTCYQINGNKVYKTQYPDSGAASGEANSAASGTTAKPWYQFWPDSGAADGAASGATTPTKSWYQFW
jgi:hypothetical protein